MRRPGSIEAMAEVQEGRANDRSKVARRLVGELAPFRTTLFAILGLVMVAATAQGLAPYLVGRAIDRDITRGDGWGLLQTMVMLLAVYLGGATAGRAQTRRVGSTGQKVLASLRERLFVQLQALPLGYFDKRPIGDLMSRVVSDVDTLNQLLSQGLIQLLGAVFGLVGILIAMLSLHVELALVCFTIIPVMLGTTAFFAARARAAYRKTRETVGDVTANLQEEIGGVRQAQAFDRTEANIKRFRERNAANRDANVSAVGVTSAFSPSIELLSTLSMALVIGYGGRLVLRGELSIGLMAAFLLYTQQFFRPLQLAASVYTLAQSALAGAERMYAILDEPREPQDTAGATVLQTATGRLRFDHVSFGYDAQRSVLHDVSFDVEPGWTVALVGKTGAGKTTIASLLPRFYDATGGTVSIDGHDVKQLTRASLRRQMALVPQEPFLFSGTIADNIAYGKPGASREEIESASKAVSAHDFIAALSKGYDSVIGEGGSTLSVGQRQLLSFTRAVLANPRVLILDEATANVDTRTEALIQSALEKLLAGRTSVVIAHRLSTIRHAQRILVIDQGRVAEQGTHDELVALGGLYAELNRRQFREPSAPSTAA